MANTPDNEDEVLQQEEPAGKVEFDSRGKAVWRWARDVLDSTSILLKRLDNKYLALEPTRKVPTLSSAQGQSAPETKPKVRADSRIQLSLSSPASAESDGGGFDPYNSSNS